MSTSQPSIVNAPVSTHQAVANTLKGSLGNLVEWFDVYAYTVFATYFEGQFFDKSDTNSNIYVYAVFAITFVMRPVGSWFFGRYADRHGRKAAMVFSVSLMAAASMLVAILPTRSVWGVGAVVALILCRLVQGFATGGEYGTSATYMSEAATAGRRGFFSSFQYVTLVGGQVLAQIVLLIMNATMTQAAIADWGWRIPFAIGGLGALVVLWLRRTMDESLSSEHLADIAAGRDKQSGSLGELFRSYWRPLLLCFLFTLGGTVAFYTYSVNAPAMVRSNLPKDPQLATWINLGSLLVLMLLQPLGGLLSDKIGRKPLLVFFGIGGVAWSYYLITHLAGQKDPWVMVGMLLLSFVILTGYTSINAIVKAELFPAHIRALGLGLGYGLANSIFGGTSPMIYAAAKQNKAVPQFAIYVTVCIAISLICYSVFLKNKAETHLDREQHHAYQK